MSHTKADKIRELQQQRTSLIRTIAELRDCLMEFVNSGISWSHPSLPYVEMQIGHDTLEEAQRLLRGNK